MIVLAALILCQSPAPAQDVTLTTYTFGGKAVAAKVPGDPGPIGEDSRIVSFGGKKYLLNADGRIARRFAANGGWSEVREGYAAAVQATAPDTPEWRVKVFVLPRNELLDVDANGVARVRRSIMEASEVDLVAESTARFAAMAEAAAHGKIKVRVDFEIDSDPAPQTVSAGHPAFGADFLTQYLASRINGGLFEAEDRVYRGPFDSVFVVHGGLCGPMPSAVVNNTLVTPLAFYAQGRPVGNEALSIAMFNGWVKHLAFAASKAGYGLPTNLSPSVGVTRGEMAQGYARIDDPEAVFAPSMWGKVWGHQESPTQDFVSHRGTSEVRPRAWSEVAADPFALLPFLTSEQVAAAAGAKRFQALGESVVGFELEGISQPERNPFELDARYEPGHEAAAALRYDGGQKQLTLVDASFAELFGSNFDPALQPGVLGWLPAGNRLFLVIQSNVPSGNREGDLVQVPGFKSNSAPAFLIAPGEQFPWSLKPNGKIADSIPVRSGMIVKDAQDPVQGDVLSLTLRGLVRTGSAQLAGQRDGPAIISPAATPFLSFMLKVQNPEPMTLRFVPADGGPDRLVRVLGRWPKPAEAGEDRTPEVAIPPGDDWKRVVLDLSKLDVGPISAIYWESSEWVGYWPSPNPIAPTVLLDDMEVLATAPVPANELKLPIAPAASATSEAPYGRSLFAAQADQNAAVSLLPLLKDPEDDVRLNAARAFQRIRSAEAVPPLLDLIRSLDYRVAEAAMMALAFQDTQEGWDGIKRAVEIGPFDSTRVAAAEAYAKKKDPKSSATFSLMLTSKSWRGRRNGAEGLGILPGDTPQLTAMVFLSEIDPGVRLAVVKLANPKIDDVCRRLLWLAVNDPSDEIRAWSCLRLVQSGTAKYANEGLKGVRDDSVGMRRRLLELIRQNPSEAFRPALRLAVADASPTVRAEALLAFTTVPGEVKREEVENTLNDPDPRVQAALTELRKAKPLS